MPKLDFCKKGLYLSGFILLTLLVSCSPVATDTPQVAATITAIPTNTVSPASPTSHVTFPPTTQAVKTPPVELTAPPPAINPCATVAVDYYQYTLDERIKQAEQILSGEIVKVEPFVWNTPDGKAPSDLCATKSGLPLPEYEQLAPVQVLVLESFKGNLPPATSINLLLRNISGALPGITTPRLTVEVGEPVIWFLGKVYNYRPENSQNPLKSLAVLEEFSQVPGGTWYAKTATRSFADINQLKERIKNPPPAPTSTPTPTPRKK